MRRLSAICPLAAYPTRLQTEVAMSLLPIFLKLDGRPGLLVGAGNVALEKINSLLLTGLRLRVIAPEANVEIRRLAEKACLNGLSAGSIRRTSTATSL